MEILLRLLVELLWPSSQLVILGLLAGYLFWRRRNAWGRRIAGGTLVLLLLYSTPFLPRLLGLSLERSYPVWNNSDTTYPDSIPIMVLASGFVPDSTLHASQQLGESNLSRLMEGIRIYKALQDSHPLLVLSGTAPDNVPYTQAAVQAKTAVAMGVNPSDIRLHDPSEVVNTASEARIFADQFGPGQQLILVTSALHMPRSMYWFRQYDLEPVPAPTDFAVKVDRYRVNWDVWPSAENIRILDRVVHEYVGMMWARVGSR